MNIRTIHLLLFFLCHELLVAAFYFEYVEGLEPCPLCMIQRWIVAGLGLTFLLLTLHNPGRVGERVYQMLNSLWALLGVITAGRHLYLQNLPAEEVPACGPGINFLLETMPFQDVLLKAFQGSGECAEVSWRLLSLSMPAWMLIFFSTLLIFSLYRLFR